VSFDYLANLGQLNRTFLMDWAGVLINEKPNQGVRGRKKGLGYTDLGHIRPLSPSNESMQW
jgi:hypothetical protein